MPIADEMVPMVEGFATIKRMFEEGARLKAEFGQENVYDFSLGNPDIPAPPAFKSALKALLEDQGLSHGYMPNPGYPHVRQAVAQFINQEQGTRLTTEHVLMTVGAAGALNIALRSLVNPGEEILTPSPYFIGYGQYAFAVRAQLTTAPSDEKSNCWCE